MKSSERLGELEPPRREVSVPVGYTEHAPPPDLAAAVVCVWTRRLPIAADVGDQRVIPDGCADILFAFGGGQTSAEEGVEADVVGPMTRPLVVSGLQPRLYVGVRLAPGFAPLLTDIPASEIVDLRLAYGELSPHAGSDIEFEAAATSDGDRVRRAFGVVRKRLAAGGRISRSLVEAVRRITAARGSVRVAALAQDLGVTRQHLARRFASDVGVSPKLFARIIRTQAVVARADAARAAYPRNSGTPNWSALAQELGYCDQPHLIDEFRELTGVTPGEWV
jgi:AraC-like DNA-binding protein